MSGTTICDFEYERNLKSLLPYLKAEQISTLNQWSAIEQDYNMAWQSFEISRTSKSTLRIKERLDKILGVESDLMNAITLIFLETPGFKQSTGLWDAGKEQGILRERERSLTTIKIYVMDRYEFIRGNLSTIAQALATLIEASGAELDGNHTALNRGVADVEISSSEVVDQIPDNNALHDEAKSTAQNNIGTLFYNDFIDPFGDDIF